jgi:hypothetical protein
MARLWCVAPSSNPPVLARSYSAHAPYKNCWLMSIPPYVIVLVQGNIWADLGCSAFCHCCAVAQMMRQIFRYRSSVDECVIGPDV